jgi:hypothetical protein
MEGRMRKTHDREEHAVLLQELEELKSLKAYDAAKSSRDQAIPLDQALAEIEEHRSRIFPTQREQ